MGLYRFILFLSLVFVVSFSRAEEATEPVKNGEMVTEQTLSKDENYRPLVSEEFKNKKGPFYGFLPYVPRQRDYHFELGSMWEDNTMYWAGLNIGFHAGKCFFLSEATCQRYYDIIGGVGGREGNTNGLVMGALRWQFVNYPSTQSHSIKFLAGVMNIFDDHRQKSSFAYGVGYAITRSVHEQLDLKLEFRVGGGDKLWGQAFFSAGVKLGSLVSYFAHSMKDLGVGTVKTTGKVIKKTGEITGKVIDKTVETTGDAVEVVGDGGNKVLEATTLKGKKSKKKKAEDKEKETDPKADPPAKKNNDQKL